MSPTHSINLCSIRAWAVGGVLLAALSCGTPAPRGEIGLGEYYVRANLITSTCSFPDGSIETTPYDINFSLVEPSEDAGTLLLTLAACESIEPGCQRRASWDGQVLSTTEDSPRTFASCSNCVMQLTETISLAILSRSQTNAVNGNCPANPLDGGVPAPTADGGIVLPSASGEGYDSILACGEMWHILKEAPDSGVPCPVSCSACQMHWSVTGARH